MKEYFIDSYNNVEALLLAISYNLKIACISMQSFISYKEDKIMKLRNVLLACLSVLGVTTMASCGGVSPELTTEGVLVVGMECAYAPFNWTETTKTESNVEIANLSGAYAEGYDVQVAKILAEELGLKLEVKALEWGALINNLNTGGIDLIIAGMSPTAERLEAIDFTDMYYESTHVMLVEKSNTKYANATKLSDFAGATVIGQTGTIYADLVEQAVAHGAVAGANLTTVPLIVNEILNGDTDATILEEPVAMGIVSQNSELTYIKLTEGGFQVADEDRIVSIGVRKGFELTEDINSVLSSKLTAEVRASLMENAIASAPSEE